MRWKDGGAGSVALDASTLARIGGAGKKPSVLLLQGPVGPFFKLLQKNLNETGCDAWRMVFNGGDALFSPREKIIRYKYPVENFSDWFGAFLANGSFDIIVLFGCERLLHRLARKVAEKAGVPVVSLEEGYFRPGFITAEIGGNNCSSPLAGRLPPPHFSADRRAPFGDVTSPFAKMCWYGFLYFLARALSSPFQDRQHFHKRRNLLLECYYWTRNYVRWLGRAHRNYRLTEFLLETRDKEYFLVPLQVADDTQLLAAGRGWTNEKLISCTISSFARHAPKEFHLVFKVHPLARGHGTESEMISALAEFHGLNGRVHSLDSGSFGLLCRHSAGVLTINSTSGLSAIAHGTPLLVLGDAIYRNPELVWCASGVEDLARFWTERWAAAAGLRRRYLAWLSHLTTVPGDYYDEAGQAVAVDGLKVKLRRCLLHGARLSEPSWQPAPPEERKAPRVVEV